MYEKLKEIHDRYTTDERLDEIHHEANTNVCEAANFFITKFLPKHKTLCGTIADKSRVFLAMSILSVGYNRTIARLFHKAGIEFSGPIDQYSLYLDSRRAYFKKMWNTTEWRKRRSEQEQAKWRERAQKELEAKKKSLLYESGMVMQEDDNNNSQDTTQSKYDSTTTCCNRCGGTDHRRVTSFKCPLNTKRTARNEEEDASILLVAAPTTTLQQEVVEDNKSLGESCDRYEEQVVVDENRAGMCQIVKWKLEQKWVSCGRDQFFYVIVSVGHLTLAISPK